MSCPYPQQSAHNNKTSDESSQITRMTASKMKFSIRLFDVGFPNKMYVSQMQHAWHIPCTSHFHCYQWSI